MNTSDGQFSQNALPGMGLAGSRLNIVPKASEGPLPINDDAPKELYHGSPNELKPGEELRLGGPFSKQWNFATTDPAIAASYAVGRAERAGNTSTTGKVYRVEPVEGEPVMRDASEHGDDTAAFISKRFKVVGDTGHKITRHPTNSGLIRTQDAFGRDVLPVSRTFQKARNKGRQQALPGFPSDDSGI